MRLGLSDMIPADAEREGHLVRGLRAQEAAAHQTLGFFQRLLELSGAKDVRAAFTAKSWEGAPQTILALSWSY